MTTTETKQEQEIAVRLTKRELEVIDTAARHLGLTRDEYIAATLYRESVNLLLDRSTILVEPDEFDEISAYLDNPPPPNEAMRSLFRKKHG